MSQKSDLKGVIFCTFACVAAIGAGVGLVGGIMQLVEGHPQANVRRTLAAGGFCILMVSAVVTYIAQRRRKPIEGDKSEPTE